MLSGPRRNQWVMIETAKETVSFTACFPILITLIQMVIRLLYDALSHNKDPDPKLCYQDLIRFDG